MSCFVGDRSNMLTEVQEVKYVQELKLHILNKYNTLGGTCTFRE